MTLRKKVLPNLFLQVFLSITATYLWLQQIVDPTITTYLYLGSIVCLGWYAMRHVPFPSLFHWFILCYIALFYFYPVLLAVLGIPFKAANHVIAGYTFLTIGGIHIYIIFYELNRKTKYLKDPLASDVFLVSEERLKRAVWFLASFCVVGAMLMVIDAGSLSLGTILDMFNSTRAERRLESGPLSLLGAYLIVFGSLVYALLPVYARVNLFLVLCISVVLVCIDVFLVVAYRVRTPVVMHLMALAIGVLYLRHRVVTEKMEQQTRASQINSRATLTRMIIIVFMIGSLGLYIRTIRGYIGNVSDLSFLKQDLASAVELAFDLDSALGGDLSYTPTVFRVIEFVPDQYDHLSGQSYYRVLFIPIPRFIWADKPVNTGLIVGRWLFPGTIIQSNPPGVMGDLYVNFGYIGILGFMVFGFIFARIDNSNSLAYYLTVATSFGSIFHFTRGTFTNVVVQLLVMYVASLLVERYLRSR